MFCLSILALTSLLLGWPARAAVVDSSEGVSALGPRSEQANYYWSFWQEGSGSHNCNNGPGGHYTATWSGGGGFVCGLGWNPGGDRYDETTPNHIEVAQY